MALVGACLSGCVPTGGVPASGAPGLSCDGVPCVASPPVDCVTAQAGLEFAPFTLADFEQGAEAGAAIAQYVYTYSDDTASLRYGYPIPVTRPSGYQPPAVAEPRCSGAPATPENHVLHLVGGPFLGWGGGMGIAMSNLSQNRRLCLGQTPLPDYCPPPTAEPAVQASALDVSAWDGVAVWARRGPRSQALLRVLVGDKHTDDDVSFLSYRDASDQPRHCERVRECACLNHMRCDFYDSSVPRAVPGGGYYCGAPGTSSGADVMMATSDALATNTCNTTRCDEDYPAYPGGGDPAFAGRPCTPFALRDGVQSSYCFRPGVDPPPAEPDQRCGDHFTFPLHLTTEWQLYLAPFSGMAQQGFAKRAPFLDLASVSVVRLTWDAGDIDYYIDDLRFYRVPRR